MLEIMDATFQQEVLNSDIPVVVDFWASWCGPCKMVAPIMEELNNQYGEKLKFTKLNVDDNPSISLQYGIVSIPTIMVVKEGKIVQKIIGFRPKADFENILNNYI